MEYYINKNYKTFHKSCNDLLNIKESQYYYPILSLYFHYHNTKNSFKKIDIDKKYNIIKILNKNDINNLSSNCIIKAIIKEKGRNKTYKKELFCKIISLLDPIHIMMNHYQINRNKNHLIPNNYYYNTHSKINSMNNNAYIDSFFSYICGQLSIQNKIPSFPIFYGNINGIIDEYNFDISEELHDYENEPWFNKYNKKLFNIYEYYDSNSDSGSDSESGYLSYEYISTYKNTPVQAFFIEKLDGTLDDLLYENLGMVDEKKIKSALFQTIFALIYLQKHYYFIHNDLHVENIMYKKTNIKYLYYKYNNLYFKIPTYGYIFKIIDFGRSIFKYKKKLFYNDSFSNHGEAGGQYNYPNHLLFDNDSIYKPNFNFDMCRLSFTILESLDYDKDDEISSKNMKELLKFIYLMTINKDNISLYNKCDDFQLYIDITNTANNSLPYKLIYNDIFKEYRIQKKKFPKKNYYHI